MIDNLSLPARRFDVYIRGRKAASGAAAGSADPAAAIMSLRTAILGGSSLVLQLTCEMSGGVLYSVPSMPPSQRGDDGKGSRIRGAAANRRRAG